MTQVIRNAWTAIHERQFLMKDPDAVKEAVRQGAKIVEADVRF